MSIVEGDTSRQANTAREGQTTHTVRDFVRIAKEVTVCLCTLMMRILPYAMNTGRAKQGVKGNVSGGNLNVQGHRMRVRNKILNFVLIGCTRPKPERA
jgi:hypothetical protein